MRGGRQQPVRQGGRHRVHDLRYDGPIPQRGSHDDGQRAGILCDRDGWQHLGLWVRVLSSDPDEYDPFEVDEVQRCLSGPIQTRKLTLPRGPLRTQEIEGVVRSKTGQPGSAERQPQAFVDQRRDPRIFERDEGSYPKLSRNRVRFPRIATHEMGERDGFRMPTARVDKMRSRARRSPAYVASGSTVRPKRAFRTNAVCGIWESIRFTGVSRGQSRSTKAFAVDYHVTCRRSRHLSRSEERRVGKECKAARTP